MEEYSNKDKRFLSFNKENTGVSDSRNFAIKRAQGEYLVFVDSDDFIDVNFLEEINKKIIENYGVQILKLQNNTCNQEYKVLMQSNLNDFTLNGQDAFVKMRKEKACIELPWSYCILRKFWQDNNFEFSYGKIHEDFGLLLIVLLKAQNVVTVKNTYYNYVIRENSIMTNKSYENELRKAKNKLEHYDFIIMELKKISNLSKKTEDVCLEYITTVVCLGMKNLNKKDKKNYKIKLREKKVLKNIKISSITNIIKKIVFAIMIYI